MLCPQRGRCCLRWTPGSTTPPCCAPPTTWRPSTAPGSTSGWWGGVGWGGGGGMGWWDEMGWWDGMGWRWAGGGVGGGVELWWGRSVDTQVASSSSGVDGRTASVLPCSLHARCAVALARDSQHLEHLCQPWTLSQGGVPPSPKHSHIVLLPCLPNCHWGSRGWGLTPVPAAAVCPAAPTARCRCRPQACPTCSTSSTLRALCGAHPGGWTTNSNVRAPMLGLQC